MAVFYSSQIFSSRFPLPFYLPEEYAHKFSFGAALPLERRLVLKSYWMQPH